MVDLDPMATPSNTSLPFPPSSTTHIPSHCLVSPSIPSHKPQVLSLWLTLLSSLVSVSIYSHRRFGGVSAVLCLPPEHHNTTSIACSDYMLRGKNVGGSQVSSPTLWRALYVERYIDKGIVRYHFTSVIAMVEVKA
ncbi:hypothetical protein DFH07DRAFT_940475 [Mycena maculata]|uniref:Uncharacterized protein n=1 Tax=Mycena maculata TaxID=230809 RepID=A0AAD7NF75_9AGAR|nr:hypothetical protein DFH07DRAFT_940475 [Mycena maculata]